MAIPSYITTELTNLQKQVAAATPLVSASRPTIVAMQLNAAQLVSDVQAALTAPNNILDIQVTASDPLTIIPAVLGELTAAQDQTRLATMRGIVGRVASNLNQLP